MKKNEKEKFQVWSKISEKFDKYIIPSLNQKKELEVDSFYWFGSRMSGKTLNICLIMWKIWNLNRYKVHNWVWARDRPEQAKQTFFTILQLIPFSIWTESQKSKNQNNKIKVNKSDLTIRFRRLFIQVVALQGRYNLATKKGKTISHHALLGYSFPVSDVRFFVFEEAYETNKISRDALKLAARIADKRFYFYLFNNYSKISDVVQKVENWLAYDPFAMGEKTVTDSNSDLKNVKAEQEVLLKKEKIHVWRFNFLLLKKYKMLSETDEKTLWDVARNDPSRAGTVLFGKCGNPARGLYGDLLKKIQWIELDQFFWKINNESQWSDLNFFSGIDLGYLNDDSAISIILFSNDYKNLIVFDSALIKTSEKNVDLPQQADFFSSFLKKTIEKINRQIKIDLYISFLLQNQLAFNSWFAIKKISSNINIKVFSSPPSILERVGFLQRKIQTNKVFFIKTKSNKILFDQLDAVSWKNSFHKLERIGRQDLIESLEYAFTGVLLAGY